MRLLLGMIIGMGLTIGGAYIYDSMGGGTAESSPGATAARPMVNWDVVDRNWQRATSRVKREWDRLAAK
jgi:hypothetical protein